MIRKPVAAAWIAAAGLAVLLAACGEREQTASGIKTDAPAWKGTGTAYAVPGWKQGDRASWEQQLRTRQQGQNEYARVP